MSRRVLLGVACLSLASVGLGPSSAAPLVPTCAGAQLRLSGAGPMSPETGEIVRAFALRNRGAGECALAGYPGVRLLDKGRVLPFTYRWGGRYPGTGERPRRIVLAPGRAVAFVVAKYRCDAGTLKVARGVAVIPPDTTQRLTLRFGLYPIFGYCQAYRGPNRGDPGNTVYIGPVEAFR